MNVGYNYSNNAKTDDTVLAYDLRQSLANLLDRIRCQILQARIERNYPFWFQLLDCLYIEVDKKLDDDERKEYNVVVTQANKIIEANHHLYTTNSNDPQSIIYTELKRIDLWINRKMEKYDMFGSKFSDDEGL